MSGFKDRKYWGRIYGFHKAKTRTPRNRNLFRLAGWSCEKCGAKENLTRDHIVPVSKGGANGSFNLQVLCKPCNERKADKVACYTSRKKARKYAMRFAPKH